MKKKIADESHLIVYMFFKNIINCDYSKGQNLFLSI